ncbi:retrovirus-related pol polyprotein from transposon TNT 1-94 [Tanacetum coccineum]
MKRADLQRALELSLKDQGERTQGPACPVVIRETDYGRIQPLPDVQDAELALTDSEMESDEEAPEIYAGDQDEGQAGPNPGEQDEGQDGPNRIEQDEGQAGSNPDAAESQPQSSHEVHAGPNLEHIDSNATDASTQQNPKQMGEEFTTTAYPNELSFTNQFFVEKPQEEELEKTNTESEVQSRVTIPIHQDTSSVPPMTSLVIDLTVSHSVSTMIHAPLPTSTTVTATTTTTSFPPPPPQPQQSTTDPILVSKAVDEIVTDAINWAIHAPLRARFCDLPTVDMKEILQQRMFEDKYYEAHKDHKNLYNALQKSLERDYSNQLLADLDEARKKKRKRCTLGALESTSFTATQETSPSDDLMQDDSILDEHVHLSDDDDSENDHPLKDNLRKDWWKPLPEEDRPATPEPAWTVLSSNVSDVENN